MKKVTVTNVEIINAREIGAALIIDSRFTLSDGTTFEYESHNEIDRLHDLNQLGGTQCWDAKEALGADYLETVCFELAECAKKKWGTLDDLLEKVCKSI